MRVLLTSWLAVSTVLAYDAVLFSNEQKLSKEYPTIDNILSTASVDTPVVFLTYPDFTLGQFSRHVSAFSADQKVSGLAETVKTSASHTTRFLENTIHAPSAQLLSSAADFSTGQSVYILSSEEWKSMEALANQVLSKLGSKYTAVITSSDAVSQQEPRVKRVVTDEMNDMPQEDAATGAPANAGTTFDMPLNIPPYNRTGASVQPDIAKYGSCMLYMEGVNIVVQSKTTKGFQFANIPVRSNDTKWSYSDGDVKCVNSTVGNYTFTVNLKTIGDISGSSFSSHPAVKIAAGSTISFTLVLSGDRLGYWGLTSASMKSLTVNQVDSSFMSGAATVKNNDVAKQVEFVGMNSVQGWAFGCSSSQAVFFNTDNENVRIGISLYNTQVQPYGAIHTNSAKKEVVAFTLNVDDCVGTFSPGSWMAIISILVMLGGFIFGYMMLNAVQTMDRFDDPKQKQILINVRE